MFSNTLFDVCMSCPNVLTVTRVMISVWLDSIIGCGLVLLSFSFSLSLCHDRRSEETKAQRDVFTSFNEKTEKHNVHYDRDRYQN